QHLLAPDAIPQNAPEYAAERAQQKRHSQTGKGGHLCPTRRLGEKNITEDHDDVAVDAEVKPFSKVANSFAAHSAFQGGGIGYCNLSQIVVVRASIIVGHIIRTICAHASSPLRSVPWSH